MRNGQSYVKYGKCIWQVTFYKHFVSAALCPALVPRAATLSGQLPILEVKADFWHIRWRYKESPLCLVILVNAISCGSNCIPKALILCQFLPNWHFCLQGNPPLKAFTSIGLKGEAKGIVRATDVTFVNFVIFLQLQLDTEDSLGMTSTGRAKSSTFCGVSIRGQSPLKQRYEQVLANVWLPPEHRRVPVTCHCKRSLLYIHCKRKIRKSKELQWRRHYLPRN